ncbi:MAG: flagellar biosynthetic protein FliO [Legionella sp.]|nr:MAG: flagellar biosynthetic protein FliO [Legionella sp.]
MKLLVSLLALSYSILGQAAVTVPAHPNLITQTEILRIISWLFVVLLIILLFSWLAKRLQSVNLGSAQGFKPLASMTLGPKEKIMLVRAGDQFLLLGIGSGSITLLYDFGRVLPAGFDPDNKSSFAHILKNVVGKS